LRLNGADSRFLHATTSRGLETATKLQTASIGAADPKGAALSRLGPRAWSGAAISGGDGNLC
jgi:hypothetical protein